MIAPGERYVSAGKKLVRFICIWELLALPEKSPIPTWTELAHTHRGTWPGRVVLALVFGALAYHLLLEPCNCPVQR